MSLKRGCDMGAAASRTQTYPDTVMLQGEHSLLEARVSQHLARHTPSGLLIEENAELGNTGNGRVRNDAV